MQNILFDLDGTLTDPQEGILGCIEYALIKLGFDTPHRDHLKKYIGPSLWESFKEMLNTDSDEQADEAVMVYRERFSKEGKFENKPYDGIHDTLNTLKSRGYTLYICTSKPAVFAKEIAEHFEFAGFFKEIYGSQMDGSLVDKTQLIAHIIQEEKINPERSVMIGDRKYDIIGAKNNKLTPYGVSYGFGSIDELKDARHIFDSPKCIADFFIK
ncbi:MAG: HAD family hydrolase [Denitrovibrio sp.]|nr:MAG: HAD family hydrolase [Denitrovibrio sp.]